MKTNIFVVAFLCVACAFAQAPAQPQTQTVYTYGMPAHRLAVRNTAPWTCSILALAPVGKLGRAAEMVTVADLMPGESVFAGEKRKKGGLFNPLSKPSLIGYDRSSDLNIPLVALYFDKEGDGRHYVGAAFGILYVPGAGSTSISNLVFGRENIRFADDAPPSAPAVTPHFAEHGVEIPYFGAEGTAIQMFVWNSRTPARITVNGAASDELRLGNVKAFIGRSPIVVTVSAVGPDGSVRTWAQGFQNSEYFGTHAQVFVLGMSDLH
jgi:hypothetical protein